MVHTQSISLAPAMAICQKAPHASLQPVGEHGVAALYSSPNPFRLGPNQDCAAIVTLDDGRAVLIVADGLGGHAGGAEASRMVVDEIIAHVAAAADDAQLRAVILNGIEAANESLLGIGIGSASTLGLVELDGEMARPYHVGDTAVLVVGQRGRVRLRTVDHAPVAYAHAAGEISEDEALHHAHRHIVDNVIGSRDMRIEIGAPIRLNARDTLLIASDGLHDNLYPTEIVEMIRRGPVGPVMDALVSTAEMRMNERQPGAPSKPDDITVLMYRPTALAGER